MAIARTSVRDELARFAVGPGVRLLVETHAEASTEGEAVVVCASLDGATYETYDALAGGRDGRGGDPERARRFLAASVVEDLEGVELGSEIERYGSLASWILRNPHAGRMADVVVPAYLEAELPDDAELEAVEQAVYIVLDEQDPGKNPYESSHREGCEREIWADRDAEQLLAPEAVDPEAISERKCPGCRADRRLYARAIKVLGSGAWVDVARRALQRSAYLEQNPGAIDVTPARDWLYVLIARAEVSKRDAYLSWKAADEARSQR